jgi:hypothetical protein
MRNGDIAAALVIALLLVVLVGAAITYVVVRLGTWLGKLVVD